MIMNQDLKEKLEFKYSKMPEIAYYVMLIVVVSIIIASSIGTFLIRKATGTEIILIPDNIYKFIIDVLGIFVLPISVKIGGEVFVQALSIWKGVPISENNNYKTERQDSFEQNHNLQDIQKQYESFYHTSSMHDLDYENSKESSNKRKRDKQ